MSGKTLKEQINLKNSMLLVAALSLAACDDNGNFSFPGGGASSTESTAPDAAALASGVQLVERDVEAPEVFSVTENGLWDGRPSLGGVWVAHPDVTDPERVIIRNPSNGKFVIGALFRRERENPGPALQVSSDAAEELGLLAGAPASLSVVALRREEGATDPAAVATTNFDAPTDPGAIAVDEIQSTSLDSAAPVPAPSDPAIAATTESVPLPSIATDASDPNAFDPASAMAAVTAAANGTQAAAATPAAATAAPQASSLDKPFIQIGIFSIEANAESTANRLRDNGLSANVLAQQSQGRAFWRVVVGPAPTASDRTAVLDKVKALGFTDAYAVSN